MPEPLMVDTSRLKAAGITLQNLSFPAAPPSVFCTGTDPVSAAINEALPVVESPVVKGLPAVLAAVNRTGSSIVVAAEAYAETDQALGGHLDASEMTTGETTLTTAVAAQAHPVPYDLPTSDDPPDPTAPVEHEPAQLNQIRQIIGAVAPVAQHAQTVMSTVQGATSGGVGTGTTAVRTTEDDPSDHSPTEQGAEPGDRASEAVAVPPISDQSKTAHSQANL